MNRLGHTPLLLLVEDNDEDYETTLRAVNGIDMSIKLLRCADGDDALDLLHQRGAYAGKPSTRLPDLILLDLNLPSSDGREILTQIKANPVFRSIPVVVLTTSGNSGDVELCYGNGANGYLIKPVDLPQYTQMLKLLCDYWFTAVILPQR